MIKTNTSVTLEAHDYQFPNWLPVDSQPTAKPTVKILYADIHYAGAHGSTWDHLEALYMVDVETLQRHLTLPYRKGQSELQVTVLDSMVKSAVDDKNPQMLKWLSSNWLGMTEKVTAVPIEPAVDEQSLHSELQALYQKHYGTTVHQQLEDNVVTVSPLCDNYNTIPHSCQQL